MLIRLPAHTQPGVGSRNCKESKVTKTELVWPTSCLCQCLAPSTVRKIQTGPWLLPCVTVTASAHPNCSDSKLYETRVFGFEKIVVEAAWDVAFGARIRIGCR